MTALIDFPAPGASRVPLSFSSPLGELSAWRLEEVIPLIRRAAAAAADGCWVVGFVAYEAAPAFDPALRVLAADPALPLAHFFVYATAQPVLPASDQAFLAAPWHWRETTAHSLDRIQRLGHGIADGEYYQVNLTTRLEAPFSGDALAFFHALRRAQPGGYAAYLDGGAWQLLSVSPELFFDLDPNGIITTQPMKGTAARCADATADQAAARALCASAKEQAENVMIVDLLRNDLSRIADQVEVPRLLSVEALSTLWQMTSTVRGRCRPGIGLAEVFRALFPCGSVTGTPKVAAMAAIAALEGSPRGAYCGALGLIRPGGHATFNVAIRTVQLAPGRAVCAVGSGITADSAATAEHAEWVAKRRFLLRASADFELMETLRLEQGTYPLGERHVQRMLASAAHFGFIGAAVEIHGRLAELAARHPTGIWRVRLLLERGGQVRGEVLAMPATPAPARFVLARSAVASDDEFLAHKTTRRQVYADHAPPAGVFDTLLWNEAAELTEFTRGNLVAEVGGRRLTPPLSCGLLPGVLRGELLARGEITEAVMPLATLAECRRLWFINALRGWVEVEPAAP